MSGDMGGVSTVAAKVFQDTELINFIEFYLQDGIEQLYITWRLLEHRPL